MPIFARRVNNYDLYAVHAWYVPGVKGMFVLLGWFLLGNLLSGLVTGILGLLMPAEAVANYGMLVAYPLSFIPAMLYVAGKSQRNSLFEKGYKLDNSNWGPYKGWQLGLLTALLTLALMFSADFPNYLNYKLTTAIPGMEAAYNAVVELMNSMTGGPFWSSFLLTAIFAPIFEEWLCRGMVLRGLLTKMKPAWAIVVSALFFALIHLNPWQALNAFLIGVVMGIVYYRTGSLKLTMLIHFINNGLAVVFSQIDALAQMDYLIEAMPKGLYSVLYLVAVLVLAACIMAFRRIPLQQHRGNIDEVNLLEEA